jgi:HEPN domain-containing protein
MNREIAFKWLKQALHDLEMAERNIGIGSYDIFKILKETYKALEGER